MLPGAPENKMLPLPQANLGTTTNGAFVTAATTEDRIAIADGMSLTVRPNGRTALFRRNGKKFHFGGARSRKPWKQQTEPVLPVPAREVEILVGEIDGVRCYLTKQDGAVHAVLTRDNIEP